MNFSELISFSKLFSVVMGFNNKSILSPLDVEVASEVLKRMADESCYWTYEQKELYKLMVEAAKDTKR